jgi:membrane protease YdiL (CAAX protease family)
MSYIDRYDEYLMRIHDVSSLKFLFVVYAFMCTWSNLTYDALLSLTIVIENFTGTDLSFIYIDPPTTQNLQYLSIIVLAPVSETIIFQVIIQNITRKITKGILLSICISAVLFSFAHLTNNIASAINALGLGLAFAITYEYVRVKKGYLLAALITIALHAFWNSVQIYSLFPEKLML